MSPDDLQRLDSARTTLPIVLDDRELQLQARAYQGDTPEAQVLALIHERDDAGPTLPLVRVHSGCVTGDVFHSQRCDCHAQLQAALRRVTAAPRGAVLYLPHHEGRGIGLVNKIRAYALQDQGHDTVDANVLAGMPIDARKYDLAAAILKDLGWQRIRLLTNNPAKAEALRAEGIEVQTEPLAVGAGDHNRRYLAAKRDRMGHLL